MIHSAMLIISIHLCGWVEGVKLSWIFSKSCSTVSLTRSMVGCLLCHKIVV